MRYSFIISILLLLSTLTVLADGPLSYSFKNGTLQSGTAGANGAIYRFSKVATGYDALVKIVSRSHSQVTLINIDYTSSGYNNAWQPQVGYGDNQVSGAVDWWMEFEVSLVNTGTSTLATPANFYVTAVDIDGHDKKISEYVSLYNFDSYTKETNSLLNVSILTAVVNGITKNVGARFKGPNVANSGIDTLAKNLMATANYINTNKFRIRTGGISTASSDETNRLNSISFQNSTYSNPSNATLPVKLKSFDAKYQQPVVTLDWSTSEEINFSHFIIERSTDGVNFEEKGSVSANFEYASVRKYRMEDHLAPAVSGLLYYRLKMVDKDGSFKYSPVRVIKTGEISSAVRISAYPNPATSELRVTIPSEWQNRAVEYTIVGLNGIPVKKKINTSAGQTETIAVSELPSGIYLLKLSSGGQSAVRQIVKR